MVPLMSCSARLPVYVVFTMALFSRHAGTVIWGLYAFGTLVAASIGILFSRTLLREVKESAFVLELPPYRMPLLKNLWRYSWQRVGGFLKQAGTIIFTMSIVIWILLNLPWGVENREDSLYGRLSQAIAPVFTPAGFGDWEAAGSLVTGFVAKEAIVATMSQIYVGVEGNDEPVDTSVAFSDDLRDVGMGLLTATTETGKAFLEALTPGIGLFPDAGDGEEAENTALSQALHQRFTTLSALAFLAFVLLYVPCVATLGALKSEFGWKWALFAAVYQTGLAWVVATVIYQGGRLLGLA
jgi:ferrous iron transport protein B